MPRKLFTTAPIDFALRQASKLCDGGRGLLGDGLTEVTQLGI